MFLRPFSPAPLFSCTCTDSFEGANRRDSAANMVVVGNDQGRSVLFKFKSGGNKLVTRTKIPPWASACHALLSHGYMGWFEEAESIEQHPWWLLSGWVSTSSQPWYCVHSRIRGLKMGLIRFLLSSCTGITSYSRNYLGEQSISERKRDRDVALLASSIKYLLVQALTLQCAVLCIWLN